MSILSSALARIGISKETQKKITGGAIVAGATLALGPAGTVLGGIAAKAATSPSTVSQVGADLQNIARDNLNNLRTDLANETAKVGTAATVASAAGIGPPGNPYQTVSNLIGTSGATTKYVVWGAAALVVGLILWLAMRKK